MREKTVEHNNDCELEKLREKLINENEALNKLLRNIQNPAFQLKNSGTSPINQQKENENKSK